MIAGKRCEISYFHGGNCQSVGGQHEATMVGHSKALAVIRVGHVDGAEMSSDSQVAAVRDPSHSLANSGVGGNFGGEQTVAVESGMQDTVELVAQYEVVIDSESAESTLAARQEHRRVKYSHWTDDTASGARCRDSLPLRPGRQTTKSARD